MLTCRDARAVIARTIDDPRLPGDARAALRAHLAVCPSCQDEYETQHEVRRLLALHIEDPVPAGFSERLSARLAQETRLAPLSVPAPASVSARESREWSVSNTTSVAGASSPASEVAFRPVAVAPRTRAIRWRTVLPLLPVAATLALFVVDMQRPDVAPSAATPPAPRATVATDSPIETEPSQHDAPASAAAAAMATRRRTSTRSIRNQQQTASNVQPSPTGQPPAAPSSPASATQASASTAQNHQAAAADPANATVTSFPIVASPELANALKLSDRQRKEIDAAIERVLTPDQRRLYRERQANPEADADDRRNASERSGIRTRPVTPVPPVPPPAQPTLPPPW